MAERMVSTTVSAWWRHPKYLRCRRIFSIWWQDLTEVCLLDILADFDVGQLIAEGIGDFPVDLRFNPNDVRWNLGLTQQIPALLAMFVWQWKVEEQMGMRALHKSSININVNGISNGPRQHHHHHKLQGTLTKYESVRLETIMIDWFCQSLRPISKSNTEQIHQVGIAHIYKDFFMLSRSRILLLTWQFRQEGRFTSEDRLKGN